MRNSGRTIHIAAGLIFIAWCAAGCQQEVKESRLNLAQAEALYSLDPDTAADAQSRAILANIYDALVDFDRDLKIRPALAVNWSAPSDRSWVFELRRGVKFHNGKPFTSEDVKVSLERIGGGSAAGPDPIAGISAVHAVNDHHVRLSTVRPDPLFLNRLTQLLIVPANATDLDSQPIGTGAYRFTKRTAQGVELSAFSDSWRGMPAIKHVRFTAVAHNSIEKALATRQFDLYRFLPVSAIEAAKATGEFNIIGNRGLSVTYLWFNCSPSWQGEKNPFADADVRNAISLALDRTQLVQRLGGRDVPAHQLIPEGVFGYVTKWPAIPFDPEKARQFLTEAGYSAGFKTEMAHPPGESYRNLAIAVKQMLAPIGIEVTSHEVSFLQLLESRRDQKLPFFAMNWTFDDGDAWTFLMASLHSRRGTGDLRSINQGYSNPLLDRLIEQSQEASTTQERLARYEAVLRLAMTDLPVIPVYSRYDLYAVSDRIKFQPRLDGKLLAAEIQLRAIR